MSGLFSSLIKSNTQTRSNENTSNLNNNNKQKNQHNQIILSQQPILTNSSKKKHFIDTKTSLIFNPQQPQISNLNDPLLKILGLQQGNSFKDYKAILDFNKQDLREQRQKNTLIYAQTKNDFIELLSQLKLEHINIDKVIKILPKNIYNLNEGKHNFKSIANNHAKANQQIFGKYDKLLKYSLRQRTKNQYLSQTSKKNRFQHLNNKTQQKNKSSIFYNENHKHIRKQQYSNRSNENNLSIAAFKQKVNKNQNNKSHIHNQSILSAIVQKRKYQLNLQYSNKLLNQQDQIKQMMKNRKNCQQILQQALMFQRYYDVIKKLKFLDNQPINNINGNNRVKTQMNLSQTVKNNNNRIRQYKEKRKQKQSSSCKNYSNQNQNHTKQLNPNPVHLRLQKSQQQINKNWTQDQHRRLLYVQNKQKNQYYSQMNKISQEIVQKKNYKNNLVIKSLMNFMRQNCSNQVKNIKEIQKYQNQKRLIIQAKNRELMNLQLNKSKSKKGIKKLNISNNNNFIQSTDKNIQQQTKKVKKSQYPQSHIAIIPQSLKKIFLLYSNKDSDDLQILPFTKMSNQNLIIFLKDFEINYQKILLKNDKLYLILQKSNIDEFQFVQLIHLLASQMHELKAIQKKKEKQNLNNNDQDRLMILKEQSHIQINIAESSINIILPQENSLESNNLNKNSKENIIQTNVHKFLFSHILVPKYDQYLYLPQNLIYHNREKLSMSFLNKLIKMYKYRQKIQKITYIYLEQQKINLLGIQKKFVHSIDFIVQLLWCMKLYPKFINKKMIRFYFQYIKQQLGQQNVTYISIVPFNVKNKIIRKFKINGIMIIQNIIYLIIAKLAIQQFNCLYQKIKRNTNNNEQNKGKLIKNIQNNTFRSSNQDIDKNKNSITINNNMENNQTNQQNQIKQLTFEYSYQLKFKSVLRCINSVINSYSNKQLKQTK